MHQEITTKDCHTRQELWKSKIRLFEFAAWNKHYKSLPLYSAWKEAVEEVKNPKLKEKKIIEKIINKVQKNKHLVLFNDKLQEKWEEAKESPTYENFKRFLSNVKMEYFFSPTTYKIEGFKKWLSKVEKVNRNSISETTLERWSKETDNWLQIMNNVETLLDECAESMKPIYTLISKWKNEVRKKEKQEKEWKVLLGLLTSILDEWITKIIKENDYQNCFISDNRNNQIVLTLQNSKGYNLANSRLALFWNNNLYFIKDFIYIDNSNLHVEITAQMDYVFNHYPHVLKSSGYANITNSPLFLKDNTTCRDFCSATGRKSIYEWRTQIQPSYSVFQIETENWTGKFSEIKFGGGDEKGGEKGKFSLPLDIGVAPLGSFTKTTPVSGIANSIGLAGNFSTGPILAFLAPKDYYKDGSLYYHKIDYEEWNFPSQFSETPHLLHSTHSTVQFYFLNKILFSATPDALDIVEKDPDIPLDFDEEERQDALKWAPKTYALRYNLRTTATPSGIYHIFHSKSVTYKWEVDVRQKLQSGKFLKMAMELGIDIGVGMLWGAARNWLKMDKTKLEREIENEEKKQKKLEMKSSKQVFEAIGISKAPEDKPENEQQTERSFKSTLASNFYDVVNKKLEPSVFYNNTIDFSYDFAEFANRYSEPVFKFRVEWSTDLYDNLKSNNNLASSQIKFANTFNQFGNILRKGYWKGDFMIEDDIDNFFASILKQGVFFYEDLDNDFSNPQLIRSKPYNSIIEDINPAKVFVSEEISDTKHFRETIDFDPDKSLGAHRTYVTFDNLEAQESFKEKFNSLLEPESIHYSEGIYGNPKRSFRMTNILTMAAMWLVSSYSTMKQVLEYEGCGWCWNCTYCVLKKKNFLTVYNWKCPVDCKLIMVLEKDKEKKYELKKDVSYNIAFNYRHIEISWDEVGENTKETTEIINDITTPATTAPKSVQFQEIINDTAEIEIKSFEAAIIPEITGGGGIEVEKILDKEKEKEVNKNKEIELEAARSKTRERNKLKEKSESKKEEKEIIIEVPKNKDKEK